LALFRDLVHKIEGLCVLGKLDAGELTAAGLLYRFVVELQIIDLLSEVGSDSLNMDCIADREVAVIKFDRRNGCFIEKSYHRPDPLFHGDNHSIKFTSFQGKMAR